jgi:hypothetical protein
MPGVPKRPAVRTTDKPVARFKKLKNTLKLEKYNRQVKKMNLMKKEIDKIIITIEKEIKNKDPSGNNKFRRLYLNEKLTKLGITPEYLKYSGFSYKEIYAIYGKEITKKIFSHYFTPPL